MLCIPDGVTADLKGQVVSKVKDGERFLQVKSLDLDLHVKTVKMGVKKIFNNNRILSKLLGFFYTPTNIFFPLS